MCVYTTRKHDKNGSLVRGESMKTVSAEVVVWSEEESEKGELRQREPWKAAAPGEDAKTVGGLEKGQWRIEADEGRIKDQDERHKKRRCQLNLGFLKTASQPVYWFNVSTFKCSGDQILFGLNDNPKDDRQGWYVVESCLNIHSYDLKIGGHYRLLQIIIFAA